MLAKSREPSRRLTPAPCLCSSWPGARETETPRTAGYTTNSAASKASRQVWPRATPWWPTPPSQPAWPQRARPGGFTLTGTVCLLGTGVTPLHLGHTWPPWPCWRPSGPGCRGWVTPTPLCPRPGPCRTSHTRWSPHRPGAGQRRGPVPAPSPSVCTETESRPQ